MSKIDDMPRFTQTNLDKVTECIWSLNEAAEFMRLLMGLERNGTPPFWHICEAVKHSLQQEKAQIQLERPVSSQLDRIEAGLDKLMQSHAAMDNQLGMIFLGNNPVLEHLRAIKQQADRNHEFVSRLMGSFENRLIEHINYWSLQGSAMRTIAEELGRYRFVRKSLKPRQKGKAKK